MKFRKDAYRAFANWRVDLYQTQRPRHSVRFFRRSRNHSLFWNFVMYGYYCDNPPSVGECESVTAWSRPTTRKLLAEAVERGFMEIRPAQDDHRKRLVVPTRKTIEEYEAMVEGYLALWQTLQEKGWEFPESPPRATAAAQRRKAKITRGRSLSPKPMKARHPSRKR